jgi:hypothetical protein
MECSIFVPMLIQGHSMTSTLLRDIGDDGRFWYWRGASGRRFIHSVYPVDECPPLPGAIYVAVRRTGTLRTAIAVGRFPVFWNMSAGNQLARTMTGLGADEIHVHLLAGDEDCARAIQRDLEMALTHEEAAAVEIAKPGYALDLVA